MPSSPTGTAEDDGRKVSRFFGMNSAVVCDPRSAITLGSRRMRLAAWGLMRSTSGLGGYLRRQRGRLGAPKAITAAAHKLARIVYALVRYGGEYVKRSEAEYTEQVRGRMERQLRRRAKELGFEVTKASDPPPTDSPVSVPLGD